MAASAATVTSSKERAIAEKEQKIELEGEVLEALRNRMYRIQLDNGELTIRQMTPAERKKHPPRTDEPRRRRYY